MERTKEYFVRIKDLLVKFVYGVSDRSFMLGYFVGFWPSLLFLFMAIGQVLRQFDITHVSDFLERYIAPYLLYLIFYEGAVFLITGMFYIAFPEKKYTKGLAFGVGTTVIVVAVLAIVFGLTNFVSGLFK